MSQNRSPNNTICHTLRPARSYDDVDRFIGEWRHSGDAGASSEMEIEELVSTVEGPEAQPASPEEASRSFKDKGKQRAVSPAEARRCPSADANEHATPPRRSSLSSHHFDFLDTDTIIARATNACIFAALLHPPFRPPRTPDEDDLRMKLLRTVLARIANHIDSLEGIEVIRENRAFLAELAEFAMDESQRTHDGDDEEIAMRLDSWAQAPRSATEPREPDLWDELRAAAGADSRETGAEHDLLSAGHRDRETERRLQQAFADGYRDGGRHARKLLQSYGGYPDALNDLVVDRIQYSPRAQQEQFLGDEHLYGRREHFQDGLLGTQEGLQNDLISSFVPYSRM